MFWVVVAVFGCIFFIVINAFVFNPPESLLKSILEWKEKSVDDDPGTEDSKE